MYIYGFTPDKQIIVKVLIFLSLDQKKSFKVSTMFLPKGLAPHPLSLCHGKDPITNQTFTLSTPSLSPTTYHLKPSKWSACVSTARSHACVHVHPCTRKGQLSCPTAAPVRPAARLPVPGTRMLAKPGERLRPRADHGATHVRLPTARYKTPPRTAHKRSTAPALPPSSDPPRLCPLTREGSASFGRRSNSSP